jgi:hypothetical protein
VTEAAHMRRATLVHDRQRDAWAVRGLAFAFDKSIDALAQCGVERWRLRPRDSREQAAPERRHPAADRSGRTVRPA